MIVAGVLIFALALTVVVMALMLVLAVALTIVVLGLCPLVAVASSVRRSTGVGTTPSNQREQDDN